MWIYVGNIRLVVVPKKHRNRYLLNILIDKEYPTLRHQASQKRGQALNDGSL